MPDLCTYDYAIVRVVPHVERGEFVNAGVIVLCTGRGFLQARIELDEPRLLGLDPAADLASIRAALSGIPAICAGGERTGPIGRLSPRERFDWLVAPRSTSIQVSAVHSGRCTDLEAALDRLLETTVRRAPTRVRQADAANPGSAAAAAAWPALAYADWRETLATLHRWTQVVGKVRLALTPWLNHGWQVPLYVNSRGLGTSLIHAHDRLLEIDFDFVEHRLVVRTAHAPDRGFALGAFSVASFHRRLRAMLHELGVDVTINRVPNEVADAIPFDEDEVHASYDPTAVNAFWRAVVRADRVFKLFRTAFVGKASPVHFFWGSFDLAVTRFSGRPAPLHPGGFPGLPDAVTREAYSHEVISAGFWPGDDRHPEAAFFSYAYPTPAGFAQARVEPAAAGWSESMGEWLLPYEAVRTAADPDAHLLAFLQSTYRAAATLAGWSSSDECEIGVAGRPRRVGR